jgi:hypothetical protein
MAREDQHQTAPKAKSKKIKEITKNRTLKATE